MRAAERELNDLVVGEWAGLHRIGSERARRYANYRGGRKYDKEHDYKLNERGTGDPERAKSALIFHERWKQAEAEPRYAARKKEWKAKYG